MAVILYLRFFEFGAQVVYDGVVNHFGCKVGQKVYDVTGDVTTMFNWEIWDQYKDRDCLETGRIYRDCIDLV